MLAAAPDERLRALEEMPASLSRWVDAAGPSRLHIRARAGGFAMVEHVWHLADLEREGFGERIRRLRAEEEPFLPDFDGGRIARERNYLARDAAEGVREFAAAREANLRALRALREGEWTRAGTQDGVGRITLADMPRLMAEHDASHRREIEELLKEMNG